MKKYIIIAIGVLILGLSTSTMLLYNSNKSLQEEVDISQQNYKAYVAQNSTLQQQNRVFQLTIDQMKYYNDSITDKMLSIVKQLKIKENKIKSLQYYKDNFNKIDTIVVPDTIFVKDVNIDTLLGDQYYSLNLKLQYPNKIQTNVSFTNEKYITVSSKKETINPPKKFFLFRWFQKKHTVLTIDVFDTNPYINNKSKRFIETIK